MANKKIVMLAAEGDSTNIIYHAINDIFPISFVFIEKKESRKIFLKRRIKKLGLVNVAGQILFQVIIVKILNIISDKRIKSIVKENHLNLNEIPREKIIRFASINGLNVKEHLQKINPDVVIVNGTRIISKKILTSVSCPFINMHAGITPMYRGVHGGYWALVNNDKANCGVTVHLLDAGIDTGEILYQKNIELTSRDNFATYPYLQISKGILILQKAVKDLFQNNLHKVEPKGVSSLWYHPTFLQYIYNLLFKKVK